MKKNPLISIIVPIYNGERYIVKCINSILNQKYQNFEIILINDGSNDNSYTICKDYSLKFDNIRFVNQENGGLSDARNSGLNIATGDHICFVDIDDWVNDTFLLDFVNVLDENDTMILQSANRILPKGQQINFMNFINVDIFLDREKDIINLFEKDLFQTGYVWNKIYSHHIIKSNNLRFKLGMTVGEDDVFNLEYYRLIKKIRYINTSNYNYVFNPDSLSNSKERPFETELIRFESNALFYNYILNKNRSNNLKMILMEKLDVFFKMNIYDRLYKNEKNKKNRIERLKTISKLPKENLKLLGSKSKFRNIDYWMLKNQQVVILDCFKKLRLLLNK